jgi:hypothetical protein
MYKALSTVAYSGSIFTSSSVLAVVWEPVQV